MKIFCFLVSLVTCLAINRYYESDPYYQPSAYDYYGPVQEYTDFDYDQGYYDDREDFYYQPEDYGRVPQYQGAKGKLQKAVTKVSTCVGALCGKPGGYQQLNDRSPSPQEARGRSSSGSGSPPSSPRSSISGPSSPRSRSNSGADMSFGGVSLGETRSLLTNQPQLGKGAAVVAQNKVHSMAQDARKDPLGTLAPVADLPNNVPGPHQAVTVPLAKGLQVGAAIHQAYKGNNQLALEHGLGAVGVPVAGKAAQVIHEKGSKIIEERQNPYGRLYQSNYNDMDYDYADYYDMGYDYE